mmetsp:Transcript_21203/g.49771  ORF Transcript_21203/g.49771 Transcript_21203/m.49771 type:complete len:313 (+) Transcript_21203:1140-2078(+)
MAWLAVWSWGGQSSMTSVKKRSRSASVRPSSLYLHSRRYSTLRAKKPCGPGSSAEMSSSVMGRPSSDLRHTDVRLSGTESPVWSASPRMRPAVVRCPSASGEGFGEGDGWYVRPPSRLRNKSRLGWSSSWAARVINSRRTPGPEPFSPMKAMCTRPCRLAPLTLSRTRARSTRRVPTEESAGPRRRQALTRALFCSTCSGANSAGARSTRTSAAAQAKLPAFQWPPRLSRPRPAREPEEGCCCSPAAPSPDALRLRPRMDGKKSSNPATDGGRDKSEDGVVCAWPAASPPSPSPSETSSSAYRRGSGDIRGA